jgi:hypothetical protein
LEICATFITATSALGATFIVAIVPPGNVLL